MAARVLRARTATAQIAAGLLVTGAVFYPNVAHAQGPQARKPIYDEYDEAPSAPRVAAPSPATLSTPEAAAAAVSTPVDPVIPSSPPQQQQFTRGPTPTDRLAAQIRRARLFLADKAAAAEDSVNGAMDRAFSLEQSFTSTIASLAPPRESGERLMPGLIYVLVAAMAGSIVSRGRNVVLRAGAPFAFGVAAGWTVLPHTMRNVADLSWQYEKRFPAVADAHVRAREGAERGVYMLKLHSRLGAQYVDDKVTEAREAIESWVRKGK